MTTDERGSPEVLLIGVDACCNRVIEPLFEEGRLPNLRSIFETGASDTLTSQIPPWTASAWPSLYTGVNPGKHGVFDFLTYDGYDWGVVNASTVREHALWELLDQNGLSSVVVNVPVTHPPGEFDGAIIPGFTAPENPDCHPDAILAEVRDAIGEYRVYPTPGGDEEVFPEYLECVRMRGEAFRYLLDRYYPDFGFLQFQATDTIFHQYSHEDEELIAAVYEAVDEQIGETLEVVDPGLVLLVSDHGLGPYRGYEFRVNDFLADHGYVETQRGGSGMPSWTLIRDERLRKGDDDTTREMSPLERGVAMASKVGITTSHVRRALEVVGLDEFAIEHAPPGVVSVSDRQVDFPNSKAYMRSRVETGVRINLEGRDPEGVVPQSEYEKVREELIDLLSGVETPDGEPLFEDVIRVEEHFEGPYVGDAVDVLTVPNDWEHFLSAQLRGEHFGPPAEPWNHKLDGVVAAVGPAIDDGASLEGAHIHDVAPTVLAAFGVPVSDRMDGRVLPIVEPAGETSYPEYGGPDSSATMDEDVEGRLATLGYLE